jgi:uncharacterized protein with von Willebrand factor type A (vWA) domain
MEQRIVEFANVLRRNGVRVSLSENVDVFRALERVGVEDRHLFRDALRATLIKRAGDIQSFEELFDFFFFGLGQAIDALDRRMMEELGLSPNHYQEMLDQLQQLLKRLEGDLSDLTKALLAGDRGQLERLFREAARQELENGNQDGFRYTPYMRLGARLQLDQVQRDIEGLKALLGALAENGESSENMQKMIRYLEERLRDSTGAAQARPRASRFERAQRARRQKLRLLYRG